MKAKSILPVVMLLVLSIFPMLLQPVSARSGVKATIVDKWDKASTIFVTVKVDGNLPDSISIRLESALKTKGKGFAVFDIQKVTVLSANGNHAEFTFAVPFKGDNQYKFSAFVYDSDGGLLAKVVIEPREGTGG